MLVERTIFGAGALTQATAIRSLEMTRGEALEVGSMRSVAYFDRRNVRVRETIPGD
jgi:hypothetical protein